MCILFHLQLQRTFRRHICGRIVVNRGLYTNFFLYITYVVKLSQTLITLQDWRLSVGSIPAVAVTLRVTSLLTSADVRIFRQFGSLPKRQQPKRRTYEKGEAHSPKVVWRTAKGCGGSPDLVNPITITLIYNGNPVTHQVWEDMPVAQLLQDAASLFGFHPPFTSVVLMLYGIQPATLGIGYLLSDAPRVTDGATILVFHAGAHLHARARSGHHIATTRGITSR
jgi:hypothetical protein